MSVLVRIMIHGQLMLVLDLLLMMVSSIRVRVDSGRRVVLQARSMRCCCLRNVRWLRLDRIRLICS